MGRYDTSKETSKDDVKREASEARTEAAEAATAIKDLATGHGSVAEVKKEMSEAAAAAGEAMAAAADFVGDTVKRYFKTVFGHRLYDHSQAKAIETHEPTEAEVTPWMTTQIAAGLVIEVDKDGNRVSAPVVPPSKNAVDEKPATDEK